MSILHIPGTGFVCMLPCAWVPGLGYCVLDRNRGVFSTIREWVEAAVTSRLMMVTVPFPGKTTSLLLVVVVYPLLAVRLDTLCPVWEFPAPALEMTAAFELRPCPLLFLEPGLVRVAPAGQQQEEVKEEAKATGPCVLCGLLASSGSIVELRNVQYSCACVQAWRSSWLRAGSCQSTFSVPSWRGEP